MFLMLYMFSCYLYIKYPKTAPKQLEKITKNHNTKNDLKHTRKVNQKSNFIYITHTEYQKSSKKLQKIIQKMT